MNPLSFIVRLCELIESSRNRKYLMREKERFSISPLKSLFSAVQKDSYLIHDFARRNAMLHCDVESFVEYGDN